MEEQSTCENSSHHQIPASSCLSLAYQLLENRSNSDRDTLHSTCSAQLTNGRSNAGGLIT
jgi:hypothetical protein